MSDSTSTDTVVLAQPGQDDRWRSVVAIICLVLAVLLTTPAALAYWGQRTLNDGQRYVDTVGPLVDSPEVQQAITTTVVDAIQSQVDVEALINQAFAGVITDRPRLQLLVGPISGAVNGLIEREVGDFVASDTFRNLWLQANATAQEALIALLKGDNTGAVSLQGDQVVLDLSTVIDQVKQRLVDRGLTMVENVPIPTIDKQVVLLTAPELKQLRTIYAFTNPIARWAIWVVVLLYLGAFLFSRRRPRMSMTIGLLLAANALLLAFALSVGRQLFINDLAGTVFGPASSVFYDTLLKYLVRGWHVFVWLGVIFIASGWFAGRTSSGVAVRRATCGVLESAGAAMSTRSAASAAGWSATPSGSGSSSVVLGAFVLVWGNQISPSRLLWSMILIVGLLVGIQVLVGAGNAEGTESDSNEPADPVLSS